MTWLLIKIAILAIRAANDGTPPNGVEGGAQEDAGGSLFDLFS